MLLYFLCKWLLFYKQTLQGAMTLITMTLSITTFNLMGLFSTLSTNDSQHNVMLGVALNIVDECRIAEIITLSIVHTAIILL